MQNLIEVATNAELNVNLSVYGSPEEPLFKAGDVALLLWKPSKVRGEKLYPDMNKLRNSLGVSVSATSPTDSLLTAKSFIEEKQFYKAILKSQSPVAEPIYDWLSEEVLPSIRQHGGYLSETANMDEVLLGNIIDKCKSKKGRPTQLIQQYINGGRPAERISELSEVLSKVKPEYRMKGYNSLHSVMLALSESDRDYRDIYLSKLVSLDKSILVLNNRINGGQKAYLKRLLNEMNKEMEPALYGARFHSDEGLAWYIRKLREHKCTSIDVAKCHTRDKLKSGKQQLSVHAQFGENTKAYFIWWVGDRVSYATGEYNEVDNKPVWSSFVPSWEGNVAIFEFNGLMFEIDFTNG